MQVDVFPSLPSLFFVPAGAIRLSGLARLTSPLLQLLAERTQNTTGTFFLRAFLCEPAALPLYLIRHVSQATFEVYRLVSTF